MSNIETQISTLEAKIYEIYGEIGILKIKIRRLRDHIAVFEANPLAKTPTFKREIATLQSKKQDLHNDIDALISRKRELKCKIHELECKELFHAYSMELQDDQLIVIPKFLWPSVEEYGYNIITDEIDITITGLGTQYIKGSPIKYEAFYVSRIKFSSKFTNYDGEQAPIVSDICPIKFDYITMTCNNTIDSDSSKNTIYYQSDDTRLLVDYQFLNNIELNKSYHKKQLSNIAVNTSQLSIENQYIETGLLICKTIQPQLEINASSLSIENQNY